MHCYIMKLINFRLEKCVFIALPVVILCTQLLLLTIMHTQKQNKKKQCFVKHVLRIYSLCNKVCTYHVIMNDFFRENSR